ncbi:serine/threonine-protein kinase Nek9-like isoform X2 [Biomphalaria glabrata]|uniref:non-specific serine/threonine protein kinase n=1 Tax=Biomphalaria glabrata TaxID=6526 RepID=A0A9U8EN77_BIOGL|nr:serine/threonine-protein kinase Nek9-like isoform X2 [Biomphalaria glabrata]
MMASEDSDSEISTPSSYTFVRVLGSGAFGEAVLYQKTEDSSLVVWKEVNLARLNEKQRRDSQNEIDILSLLNHANIVSYYNHFVDEDMLFIEMEYANGGTLYDKIISSSKLWPEQDILWYLYQMSSALAYIHQYGIIHRDIKTLNIFLTKVGLVKLGDFGISRFLEPTNQMADTVVGTPYYMSPELMQGERYNNKSDIWALGCVLYEMLTLSRTFQASNPLKLAKEVVKGEILAVSKTYSDDIRSLVDSMLNKNPEDRPSADDILALPLMVRHLASMEQKVYELNSSSRRARLSAAYTSVVSVVTSKMCEMYQWGGGKITPQKLEVFTKEKSPMQVASGHSHFAAITFEKELYTWANLQGGVAMVGQLGHGDLASYKAPHRVDALLGVQVQQVACGEDFTLCVTDDGGLYAFGSDYYGCLGLGGDEEEVLAPVLLDYFSDHPMQEVACGDAHVLALTRYGDVYTWGSGEFGKLGLGSEDDFKTPQKVEIPAKQKVKHVCAGGDSSFLICFSGRLLACGSNQYNKLGFNSETSGLRKRKTKTFDIPFKHTFSTVKSLNRYNVTLVAAGKTHSGIVDSFGYLYMFGSNKFGQLGLGDFKPRTGVSRVGGVLAGQKVEQLACGDGFTVVATNENHVYSWGNGDSGRLGGMFSEQGSGPKAMCTAIPRPIFGSMHVVSCLSCRHWNTLIIAEKVLNQKTLKSRVSSPKMLFHGVGGSISSIPECQQQVSNQKFSDDSSSDFVLPDDIAGYDSHTDDSADVFSPPVSHPNSASPSMESSMPTWLAEELNNAEYIPIPSSFNQVSMCDKAITPLALENCPLPAMTEIVDKIKDRSPDLKLHIPTANDETILELKAKIEQLEKENTELKQLVAKQADIITQLRLQNS